MSSEIRLQIQAANAKFMIAFEHADAASIAGLYTAEAQLFPANSDVIRGTAAIRMFWQGVIDMGLKGARLQTVELEAHGSTAIEIGQYQLLAAGGVVADHGKYIVVWKSDNGAWKLHRDIWTTSQPVTAAAD